MRSSESKSSKKKKINVILQKESEKIVAEIKNERKENLKLIFENVINKKDTCNDLGKVLEPESENELESESEDFVNRGKSIIEQTDDEEEVEWNRKEATENEFEEETQLSSRDLEKYYSRMHEMTS